MQSLPEDLSIYELNQEKFITLFETMEKHEGNSDKESREKIDGEAFKCDIMLPTMEVYNTLSVVNQKSSSRFNFGSEEDIIYVPVKSRELLYTLDTSSMVISVYHFTSRQLKFLSSAKVKQIGM